MELGNHSRILRFDRFEADLETGELRKNGVELPLQGQPFQVLAILLTNSGTLVTREQLRSQVWPKDTFVDFDHALNTAITKIRLALGDDAEHPTFIQTLPRRGYRWMTPVAWKTPDPLPPASADTSRRWSRQKASAALIALAVVVAAVIVVGLNYPRKASNRISSIAVLPLENLSHDPEQEYFADGMTEALITELAQISTLRVISRTSIMQYKGVRKPLPQIARELNVDAIVEGAIQRSGDRVAITVQLIYAPSDRHIWAKPYERDLKNVLALQREAARAIADEIRVRLTPIEQIHLSTVAPPINTEAFQAYLKGRYYSNQLTEEALHKSIEQFQRAISLDPNYASAYAGLARSYATLGGVLGFLSPTDFFPKARAATERALQIDDTLPEAHTLLAGIKLQYEWDWPGAEHEYKQVIELNPNYAPAHEGYGLFLEAVGRFDEAIAERRRAQGLDPLSPFRAAEVGYPLYYAGQHDQALEEYRKALDLDPNFSWAYLWIGQAYVEKGMYVEAIAAVKKALALSPGNTRALATLGYVYGVSGRKTEALGILNQLEAQSSKTYVSPYFIALTWAGLSQKDHVLKELEKAYDERHPYMILLKVEPIFVALQPDPKFQDLLKRIGLQQ